MEFKHFFLVSMIFLLVIIPLSSSSIPTLGTFKQNSCVNLLQTCADCTYNNISSVTQPNGNKGVGIVVMTKVGTEFTYNFCNTSTSGTYNVNGYGNPGTVLTKWNYNFIITPSGGAEDNTLFFYVFVICAAALLIISLLFKNYVFSILSGFLFIGSGIYSMIYGFGDVTSVYTRIVSFVLIGLGIIITITSAFEFAGEAEGSVDTVTYSDAEDD